MTSKSMAFRFPEELAQVITSRAKATGRDKTTVVVEALTQAFGLQMPFPALVTTELLQEQLHQLEDKIAIVSEQLVELRQTASPDSGNSDSIIPPDGITTLQPLNTATANIRENTLTPEIGDAASSQELEDRTPNQLVEKQLDPQSQQLLEQLLAATPDPIFACDHLGRFIYINAAGARVLGLERSQFINKTYQEIGLASELVTRYSQECKAVFMTWQRVSGEVSTASVYEGNRDYEYILSPVQIALGSVDAVLCIARDITKRNQAETALRESEANYRNLFESANDSISVVNASTRRIMNANWNAARRLGYTRSELLQLSEADIFVPMDPSRTEDIFRELLATGNVTFEYLQRCKDGTLIPVESSSRAIEYEGHLAIQSVTRDIRERKQAELALRESEAYYRSLLENSTDMISWHSLEGSYLYISPACQSLLGYAPQELVGQSAYELIHPQDMPAVRECHAAVMNSTETYTVSYGIRRKDNNYICFESTCRAILDPDTGAVQEIIAVSRDITTARRESKKPCAGYSNSV